MYRGMFEHIDSRLAPYILEADKFTRTELVVEKLLLEAKLKYTNSLLDNKEMLNG